MCVCMCCVFVLANCKLLRVWWKSVASGGERGAECVSVFLEDVEQEMPKAHLELLHAGSLSMTEEQK